MTTKIMPGALQRSAERVVPYLVITVIGIILNFFQLASPSLESIVDVIFGTVINIYLYICIYSLYVKFKAEKVYKFQENSA